MLIFLILSFGLPWVVWIAMNASGLYGSMAYQGITGLLMFAPMFAAFATARLSGTKTISFSFKPRLKAHLRLYLFALLSPAVFAFLGAALYFLCFSNEFSLPADLSHVQIAGHILACVTVAPIFNALFAIGEEAGWRGFLAPALEARFGAKASAILTGIIWGIWHTPINIMGYNYGLGYAGYPWAGIVAMCVFCFSVNAIAYWLCKRTDSLLAAALLHGGINAITAMPLLFASESPRQILGPAQNGLLSGVFLLAFALCLVIKGREA